MVKDMYSHFTSAQPRKTRGVLRGVVKQQQLRRRQFVLVHVPPEHDHRRLKISKIEKRLVVIILVIVFKHKIKLKKYMFV